MEEIADYMVDVKQQTTSIADRYASLPKWLQLSLPLTLVILLVFLFMAYGLNNEPVDPLDPLEVEQEVVEEFESQANDESLGLSQRGEAKMDLAYRYYVNAQYDKALELYQEALDQFKQDGNLTLIQEAEFRIELTQNEKEDYEAFVEAERGESE